MQSVEPATSAFMPQSIHKQIAVAQHILMPTLALRHHNKTVFMLILLVLLVGHVDATPSCVAGTNKCTSCSNAFNCAACSYGYGVTSLAGNNVCIACQPANCLQCSLDAGICTQCPAYYRVDGAVCQLCNDNTNCLACPSDYMVCTNCRYGYRVTTNGTCQQCTNSFCEQCNANASVCEICIPMRGISTLNACLYCSDFNCFLCGANYLICTYCYSGMGINAFGACVPCGQPRCDICGGNYTTCAQCTSGYGPVNGICVACTNSTIQSGLCVRCSMNDGNYCYQCVVGYGPNVNGICQACYDALCVDCARNVTQCANCTTGYGVDLSTNICVTCQSPCLNCAGTDATLCTSCNSGTYLNGNTCTGCSISSCLACASSTSCSHCADGTYRSMSGSCIVCPIHCTLCEFDPISSQPSCTSCQTSYSLSRNIPKSCPEICGDLIMITSQCDDQLGRDYDGCDDYCNIMPGFQCNVTNNVSVCSYANPINMEIVSIIREIDTNSFTMRVYVWPPLYVFRSSDIMPVFKFTDPSLTIQSIKFDYASSEMMLKVNFANTQWDRDLVLQFIPDINIDQRYYATPSSSVQIRTQLYFYSDIMLKTNKMMPYLCYAVLGVGVFSAILGIFAKRLQGLESMVTCQLALLSVIFVNSYLLQPFKAARNMQYLLGLHLNIFSSSSSARLLAVRQNPSYSNSSPFVSQFGFNSTLFSNNFIIFFAIQALLFCLFIVTTSIIRLMNRLVQQHKKDKKEQEMREIQTKVKRAEDAKQYFLQWLMFVNVLVLVPLILCATIFFRNNSDPLSSLSSIIMLGASCFIELATFVVFFVDPDCFDYFRYSFKRERLAMMYYWIYVPLIATSAIILVVMPELTWPPLIPVGILLIFTIVYRPYRQIRSNIQCTLNLVIILAFFSLRVFNSYYNYNDNIVEPTLIDNNAFLFYFLAIVLLLVSVLASLVSLVYYLIYKCIIKADQQKNQQEKVMIELEQMDVMRKIKKLHDKQNTFGKILDPKMTIIEASNQLAMMNKLQIKKTNKAESNNSGDQIEDETFSDMASEPIDQIRSGRELLANRIKKQMRKQKLEARDTLLQKKQKVYEMKQKIEADQLPMTKKQRQQNNKMIFAMEVMNDENMWLRLKHAKDYTQRKMKQQNPSHFRELYDDI